MTALNAEETNRISILLVLLNLVTSSHSFYPAFIVSDQKYPTNPVLITKIDPRNVPVIFKIKPDYPNTDQLQPISFSKRISQSSSEPDLSTASSLKLPRSIIKPKLPLIPHIPLLPKLIPIIPPLLIPPLLPPLGITPLVMQNIKRKSSLKKGKSDNKNIIINKLRELKKKGSLTTTEYLRFKRLLLS